MGTANREPASELIRQQAEQLIYQLQAIAREEKAFHKQVSELQQALQQH